MIGELGKTTTIAAFATAQNRLSTTGWRDGDSRANLRYVAGPAMSALSTARIPPPPLWIWDSGVGMAAIFFPNNWKIRGNPHPYRLNRSEVTDDVVRARAAQIYHEARHAEQHFLIARLMMTKISQKGGQSLNKSEADLIAEIPEPIRKAASAQSLTPTDAELAEITAWIKDYAGMTDITKEFTLVREELKKLAAQVEKDTPGPGVVYGSQDDCDDAAKKLADHTRLGEVLRDSYEHTFTKYLKQATESDAYAVGQLVGSTDPTARQAAATIHEQTVAPPLRLMRRRVEIGIDFYRDSHAAPPPATSTTPAPPPAGGTTPVAPTT